MTDDILKRAAEAVEILPCPFCGSAAKLHDDSEAFVACTCCGMAGFGWESSEMAIAAWNRRIPDMAAAIAERDVEIERLTVRAESAEEILSASGALRDAADHVSAWFATEARHLEGPRINGLRMAMVAYDRHMQPAPNAAMKEGR